VPTDITLSNIGATEIKLRENRIEANRHRFDYGKWFCALHVYYSTRSFKKLSIISY